MINEFLHDRQTAAIFNTKSNSGARASDVSKEPIVRMSNTYLRPGKHSEEELIEGVKLGIYMKNYSEWNIDDKRLHQKYVGNESYLIKNGKIVGPVRRPVIEISTTELWKAVDAVGKKIEYFGGNCGKGEPMQAIPVWYGGPPMRIRRVCCSV
jgi:TldD protein